MKRLWWITVAVVLLLCGNGSEKQNATTLRVKLIAKTAGQEISITRVYKKNDTLYVLARVWRPHDVVSMFRAPLSDTHIVTDTASHVVYFIHVFGDAKSVTAPIDVDNYVFIDDIRSYERIVEGGMQIYENAGKGAVQQP